MRVVHESVQMANCDIITNTKQPCSMLSVYYIMDFLYDHIIKIMTTNIFMTCSQIVEIETTIK